MKSVVPDLVSEERAESVGNPRRNVRDVRGGAGTNFPKGGVADRGKWFRFS
jgi:hypothetical protein